MQALPGGGCIRADLCALRLIGTYHYIITRLIIFNAGPRVGLCNCHAITSVLSLYHNML
nr:MAG TPA: hypothetical protein [Caudoviricetes sp.]